MAIPRAQTLTSRGLEVARFEAAADGPTIVGARGRSGGQVVAANACLAFQGRSSHRGAIAGGWHAACYWRG